MATQNTLKSFFAPLGAVTRSVYPSSEGKAFITLAARDKKKEFITGAMPVTGIVIQAGVDYSITKSLKQDFFIAAFGDSPVTIVLKGISFDVIPACLTQASKTEGGQTSTTKSDQAIEFYEKHKLSTDVTNRVDIGLSTTAISYRCALIAMEAQKSGEGNGNQNIYNYTLKLIGARNK